MYRYLVLIALVLTGAAAATDEEESIAIFRNLIAMKHLISYSNYRSSNSVHTRLKFVESSDLMGTGYNIIKANPHTVRLGDVPMFGSAPDPGYTKAKIFKQSWSRLNKKDEFLLPDHVVRKPWVGEQCRQELDHELIPGVESYQRLLLANTVMSKEERKECKTTYLGEQYSGKMNQSVYGEPCQNWTTLDHNYCRNPSGMFAGGPSCFVNGIAVRCSVPFCTPGLDPALEAGAFLGPYRISPSNGNNLEHFIYFESKRVCSEGILEMEIEKENEEPEVTEVFKMEVCELPREINTTTEQAFYDFIDMFGTSIIVGGEMGKVLLRRMEVAHEALEKEIRNEEDKEIKSITDIYENGTEIVNQYLTFDLDKMSYALRKNISTLLGSRSLEKFEWLSGSAEIPLPISLILTGVDSVIDIRYWKRECDDPTSAYSKCCQDLESIHSALYSALVRYPQHKGVMKPQPRLFELENIVAIPLKWPAGFYGLPGTQKDCPHNWRYGYIMHGTHKDNELSPDLFAAYSGYIGLGIGYVVHRFCSKVHDKTIGGEWPEGSYCINRVGTCPNGFKEGFIYWRDYFASRNFFRGTVPDGEYGKDKNLKLEYCCREDGSTNVPILLPTDKPFYLMMIADECQQVFGMTVMKQSVFWDSNDWCALCSRFWQQGGLHPKNDYWRENNKLYYCYYEPDV